MSPAPPGLVRNALGSLAVLGVVAAMTFGFPLIDRALPAARPVPVGAPYDVGGKVTLVPPNGASVDLTRTRPSLDRGMALFVVDGIRIAISVAPYRGSVGDAAVRLRSKITNTTGFQITGADRPVQTGQGVGGIRGAYGSPGRLGEYAVFVSHDTSVEVTASGPEPRLRNLLGAIDQSLRSVRFGVPS